LGFIGCYNGHNQNRAEQSKTKSQYRINLISEYLRYHEERGQDLDVKNIKIIGASGFPANPKDTLFTIYNPESFMPEQQWIVYGDLKKTPERVLP